MCVYQYLPEFCEKNACKLFRQQTLLVDIFAKHKSHKVMKAINFIKLIKNAYIL